MGKEIKTLKDLIEALESLLELPENHHLVAVFENNDSDEIAGWVVVEDGVEGDYPMYTSAELLEKFKK